jgi:hypothetical protein
MIYDRVNATDCLIDCDVKNQDVSHPKFGTCNATPEREKEMKPVEYFLWHRVFLSFRASGLLVAGRTYQRRGTDANQLLQANDYLPGSLSAKRRPSNPRDHHFILQNPWTPVVAIDGRLVDRDATDPSQTNSATEIRRGYENSGFAIPMAEVSLLCRPIPQVWAARSL